MSNIRQNGVSSKIFKGRKDVLRNFYPCRILYKNSWFNCSEQIYQYEKGLFHGISKDTIKSQLLLKVPYEQKSLAKHTAVCDAWMEAGDEPNIDKLAIADKQYIPRNTVQIVMPSKQSDMCTTLQRKKRGRAPASAYGAPVVKKCHSIQ